ncbi:MAG TPA: M1 family aminopeptidase, partial [Candidatus Bathyarchaeia archaeon]|nr:M1 family aminopeptidase [Candidatus Bathyarchaeia archaeon]
MRLHSKLSGLALCAIAACAFLAGSARGVAAQTPRPPIATQTPAQAAEAPYWQQRADYTIKATLDPREHALGGSEAIIYTNNSPDSLDVFYMHLYPNAFRDKASPLIRDFMQGTLYFFVGLPKSMRGWIDLTKLTVDGAPVSFKVDGTILSASFPKPVAPGGAVTFELTFKEKIPPRVGRSGYAGEQYDMAQWYPKMVVYDADGWHPDQYRMGEFYGEYGTFDVHITLPEKYVVAATGVPVSGDPGWKKVPLRRGGSHPGVGSSGGGHPGGATGAEPANSNAVKTVEFRAENVHDFAWCASPTFAVQDTLYNGYHIMSFFNVWNRSWADTALAREIRTMRWLEKVAGPYPYPQISAVDCMTHGGMEYPMLVMNGSADEGLILHELSHQYFYGALGNNERAEAWLDEGFAQYCVFQNTTERYGIYGKSDTRMFPYSLFRERRMWDAIATPVVNLHRTGYAERIATPVQEFKNGYSTMPYIGAPLFLRALRYTVGDDAFEKIIRTYVDRWKFKHVDEDAFRSVCEEVSGKDLRDFFKEWLHTTKDCDYALSRFQVKPAKSGYTADVRINRKGEMIMPLKLAFRLTNGNTVTEHIDAWPRSIDTTFTFETRPVSAAIDPDNEIVDIYQLDNFLPRRSSIALDVPFNTYYPLDSYQYRILPIGYYNDVDGGKAGLRLRGSYDDYYRMFTVQGLYGFESRKTDVYASYETPLGYFGKDATLFTEGFIREGRQGAFADIGKIRRASLFDPLAQHLDFWLGYHELKDRAYVLPFTYDKGRNLWGGLGLQIGPKTDLFATDLSLSYDRSLWWSELHYETFKMNLRLWPAIRFTFPLKPSVRVFYGHAAIDPPLQGRFTLAGANALAKERFFWLRSIGAFPKDQYNNFHVAGDANLRGYYDGAFAFKRVLASNVELQLPFPLPVSRSVSRMLDRRLSLFYDAGKVLDERPLEGLPPGVRGDFDKHTFDPVLSDFGASVSLWKITAEFPLYLSNPKLVG